MNLQGKHFAAALGWMVLAAACYMYFASRERPASHVSANGEISIPRAPDGHFYIDGTINGRLVSFMVDTGASSVAVSEASAQALGLKGGQAARFSTAAGDAVGRMYSDNTVGIAGISVEGLNIGALPGMGHEALLGQNFLRHFDMTVRDNALLLRARL